MILLKPTRTGAGRGAAAPCNAQFQRRDRAAYRAVLLLSTATLAATFGYAWTRYVHHGPVDPQHVPLYVTNKAVSWSSVVLLGIAVSLGPLGRLAPKLFSRWVWYRKSIGLAGAALATAHLLLSVPIFNMFYYTAFFNVDGTLKFTTELSFLAGALGWTMLLVPVFVSIPNVQENLSGKFWLHLQSWNLVVLLLTFGHVAWLGWSGWFEPVGWYGGMPPITLLCCGGIAAVFLLRLAARVLTGRTPPTYDIDYPEP